MQERKTWICYAWMTSLESYLEGVHWRGWCPCNCMIDDDDDDGGGNDDHDSWSMKMMMMMMIKIMIKLLYDNEFFHLALIHIILASFLLGVANSAKPDQTPQNAASDQVSHCLLTKVSLKIWIKVKNTTQQPWNWKWISRGVTGSDVR